MVKRTASADNEPDKKEYKIPSEKEHLFIVNDIFDYTYKDNIFGLDADTLMVQLEVVGGDENGRTMINRISLDDNSKGFFATRLFLKSIGEEYKGKDFPIDSDNWKNKQFYAIVVHALSKDGKRLFANIGEYNFDKLVEQKPIESKSIPSDEIQWDK